ncbi:DUF3817 domain-containing protein [Actinomadura darangshiensis]|uniref:DUF3817 domain-containing protein n=1 Tax=Actinomadura darangshiensis TaxID=705336 RepID=A0A4V2YXS8_9ACTN|nr:DUF3817 domain-containing protein [Actinomadura darangshiensis]
MRALRIAAAAEAVSLAVLLVNLATAHVEAISSLVGPLHGIAYLEVIVLTLLQPAVPGARWRAVVPGVGGLLAAHRLGAREGQPS